MNSALPEFLRITQDPNTESVARACRARGRAGIPDPPFPPQRLTREFASVAEGSEILKFWAVLEFRYWYSTGIPCDFELILILILILILVLNCSTVTNRVHRKWPVTGRFGGHA